MTAYGGRTGRWSFSLHCINISRMRLRLWGNTPFIWHAIVFQLHINELLVTVLACHRKGPPWQKRHVMSRPDLSRREESRLTDPYDPWLTHAWTIHDPYHTWFTNMNHGWPIYSPSECVTCHIMSRHGSRRTCHTPRTTCHASRITRYVSRVACHMPRVTCDMPLVTCLSCHVARDMSLVTCDNVTRDMSLVTVSCFVTCHAWYDVTSDVLGRKMGGMIRNLSNLLPLSGFSQLPGTWARSCVSQHSSVTLFGYASCHVLAVNMKLTWAAPLRRSSIISKGYRWKYRYRHASHESAKITKRY